MRRGDGAGEDGPVEGDVGASFGGCIARSEKGRGKWHSGSGSTMFGPVKEMLSESVGRCGGWEREKRLLCWHWSHFRTREARREDRGWKGSRHSRWW